ncbi:MAG: M48 family metalloprotease, partial [Acidobacteriales bacterium]|nr:M48 family metalloprotease [Terriglobales bacterium]
MFSDQQEVYLGDATAERLANEVTSVDAPKLNAYLQQIGDRLVQHLPKTEFKFRFYLIDSPTANAYSIAGGRVYVTRKMAAMTQNEDELAGVLAHELGHIATHQTAIEFSTLFRAMGITEVSDRESVYA